MDGAAEKVKESKATRGDEVVGDQEGGHPVRRRKARGEGEYPVPTPLPKGVPHSEL